MISFFIEGDPVPQARPRTFWHKGSKKIVTMNPRSSEQWKKYVKQMAYAFRPREPIDWPAHVTLEFYLPRPKSAQNKIWADVRPDADNYAKAILDALQSAEFFTDDARVVWLDCKKLYSIQGKTGVQIIISDGNGRAGGQHVLL